MSDSPDKESRTEEATDKRRRDAREEGQVPRSRDMSAATVTLAAVGLLIAVLPGINEVRERFAAAQPASLPARCCLMC